MAKYRVAPNGFCVYALMRIVLAKANTEWKEWPQKVGKGKVTRCKRFRVQFFLGWASPQCNIFILICFCLALEHNRLPPGSAFRKLLLVVLSRHNGLLGIEHKKSPLPIVFRSSIIIICLSRYFSQSHSTVLRTFCARTYTWLTPGKDMGCWGLNPAWLVLQDKCPTHCIIASGPLSYLCL